MALVMFYHLTRSPAAQTLRAILPRALAQGWRVMLRADAASLTMLDSALWEGDGFLPHGTTDSADQPIWLGTGALDAGRDALALVGADCTADEVRALQRVWILFDGNDPASLDHARGQWRDLTAAGLGAQYWSEESGNWVKKTEKLAG